jgi:FKBP-type peptidyl-prolyl cis-trans isomerase
MKVPSTAAALVAGVFFMSISACTLKDEGAAPGDGAPAIPAPKDVAAPPADALKTASGIAHKVITVGLGSIHPTPKSTVRVHYTGWTTDGKMFDSSFTHGAPITFALTDVITGWTEGLQLMVVGEKRRFWIPGNLAYDNLPDPRGDNPKGMLVFDIELLDIR